MTVIECRNLTKTFRSHHALDNLSLTIKKNKITGLIGRNGAGKTTLLKILAGYWRESTGEVKVFAERPFNSLLVSANMIFVDDQMKFPDSLTLSEILHHAGNFYDKWDMGLAKRLFDYFSFEDNQVHSQLSKGKKSTFNIIVGLSSRCALTLFDEPATGMDTAVRQDFYRALLKDYLHYPRSIIISSHHVDEIEDLLEDILLIDEGEKYLHLPIESTQEYAIGLTGPTAILKQWMYDKEVFYKKRVDQNTSYVVIKNDQIVANQATEIGLTVSPVTTSDLCVYLTSKRKGEIDDVFIKS